MIEGTPCIHYDFHAKDGMHALFYCAFAKKVWDYLPFGDKWKKIPTVNFKDLLHKIYLQFLRKKLLYLLHAPC